VTLSTLLFNLVCKLGDDEIKGNNQDISKHSSRFQLEQCFSNWVPGKPKVPQMGVRGPGRRKWWWTKITLPNTDYAHKNCTSNFSQARSTLPEDGSQRIRNMSEFL